MLSFCEGHLETSRYKQPIKIKFSTSEAVTLELQLRQFNNFVKKTYVNSASRIIQIDQSFFEPSKLVATIEHWLLITFFYRVWFLRFRPPYEIFGIIRLSAASHHPGHIVYRRHALSINRPVWTNSWHRSENSNRPPAGHIHQSRFQCASPHFDNSSFGN